MPATYDPLRAAFYVSWDPTSLAALQQHYRDIDLLIPERLHSITARWPPGYRDRSQACGLEAIAAAADSDDRNSHHAAAEQFRRHQLAHRRNGRHAAKARQRASNLAQQAVQYLTQNHFAGLVVDFEEIPEKSQKDFSQFIVELAADLHGSNLKLMVSLPAADWIYDYAGIGKSADAVILMNYDQHWRTSAPGPIAAQDWFVRNIDAITEAGSARKNW